MLMQTRIITLALFSGSRQVDGRASSPVGLVCPAGRLFSSCWSGQLIIGLAAQPMMALNEKKLLLLSKESPVERIGQRLVQKESKQLQIPGKDISFESSVYFVLYVCVLNF
ncbi:hypothetical protein AG4045_017634 [Apium graveolens]|uniref:Uncharacterized protein n=1 Tax=Apium graveolens TaxID=4045 RepID=A0A6L5BAL4_APIGR|nr:hypothetical protein AG4045_017634 [Apium graveolens]